MRQLTKHELNQIKLLNEKSVEFCLIEPTETGLKKSILDATGSVRNYLKSENLHDYDLQGQGQEQKILISSIFVNTNSLTESIASLYRPNTKKGDPRIWFRGLGRYANSNDILAIIYFDLNLYVLNITQIDIHNLMESPILNPLQILISEISNISNQISDELLKKLKIIASNGFVPALLNADTAIGRTLESLLGIRMNSLRTPDYKGIELKSARELKKTRKGLFGKTPNWELSKFKSASEILDNFGYWKDGIFRLYNTIRATGKNAQGLILKTDYKRDYLIENSDREEIGDFLIWELEVLRKSLSTKHRETFWISAESKFENENEYFLYKSAIHTKNPLVNQFGLLIDIGAITLDYPIKRDHNGQTKDKGCNFKLRNDALDLLFPPSKSYNLLQ